MISNKLPGSYEEIIKSHDKDLDFLLSQCEGDKDRQIAMHKFMLNQKNSLIKLLFGLVNNLFREDNEAKKELQEIIDKKPGLFNKGP